jgi:ABC-2 type transport system permease protein
MTTTGLRRAIQVVGALMRTSLSAGLQYRADFLFDALTGAVRAIATLAPLWLVYGLRDDVAGVGEREATLVLGCFLLLAAVVHGVVEPNLGAVVEGVRSGSFDLTLLKPADAQLLVSLRTLAPGHVWDLLAALLVLGEALGRGPAPSLLDLALAAWTGLCGVLALYGVWLGAIAAAFVFVRVDNLRFLLLAGLDAGRWPARVFSRGVATLLTVVFPVAVATTLPARALAGHGTWCDAIVAAAVAAAFLAGSRRLWRAALARYTSASS